MKNALSTAVTRRAAIAGAAAIAVGGKLVTAQDPAPEPTFGGTLRVTALGTGQQDSLHPANTATPLAYMRNASVYETLVTVRNRELVNVLAESLVPNKDASEWTITLRSGITFHNGKSLTAQDVIASIAAFKAHPLGNQITSIALADLENSVAVDDLTAKIVLTQPFGTFDLSLWSVMIVSSDVTDFETDVIGTGPFKLDSYAAGDRAVFSRNENYWGDPANGPFLDGLELIDIADEQARFNALVAGQADFATAISPTQALTLEGQSGHKLVEFEGAAQHSTGLTMNVTRAPFDDINVRRAVQMLVDREKILENAALGFGIVGNDLMHHGALYYNFDIPQREYDPEQAAALITEAGATGAAIEIYTSPYETGYVEVATLVAEMLNEAGFEATVNVASPEVYFTDFPALINAQMKSMSSGVPTIIEGVLYQYPTGGAFNVAGFSNAEYDAVAMQALSTTDLEERASLLNRAQQIVWDESLELVPVIFSVLHGGAANLYGVDGSTMAKYPSFGSAFLADA